MKTQIEKRIKKLRKEIEKHNYNYYVLAKQKISDPEYDALYRELERLETENPHLITSDSPTQKVGSDLTKESNLIRHQFPMESIKNEKDLNKFDIGIKKFYSKNENMTYVVEPKIDGASVSLEYRNGVLFSAATRGDGTLGEDITENIKTIKSIPQKIDIKRFKDYNLDDIVVRGEIFIYIKDFEKVNMEQEEKGEKLFENPRNTAAGILKTKDSSIVAKRPLNNFAYSLLSRTEQFSTQEENLKMLKKLGFEVNEYFKKCSNIEEVIKVCDELESLRDKLPYEIDGAVIKVNSIRQQKLLPQRSKYPRWAAAFKFDPEKAITNLEGITWQVGRTGVITPVAELAPIKLAGSTIRRASLHNFDFIREKDIRIGDQVIIAKGGDVIPKVVEVLLDKRTSGSRKSRPPDKCPACGTELTKIKEEIGYYCQNPNCPGKIKNSIYHFVSRNALDIEGIAETVVDNLIDKGIIKSSLDLFKLDFNTLANLNLGTSAEPRMVGDKNALKVINSLEKAKTKHFAKWLFALGIPKLGEIGAQDVAEKHKSFQEVKDSEILKDIITMNELIEKAKHINPLSKLNPTKSEGDKNERKVKYHQLCDKIDEVGNRLVKIGWYKLNEPLRSIPKFVLTGKENTNSKMTKSVKDDRHLLQSLIKKAKIIGPKSKSIQIKSDFDKEIRKEEYAKLCEKIYEIGQRLVKTGLYKQKEKQREIPEYVLQSNEGVGVEAARSILNFLNSADGFQILEKMKYLGINPKGSNDKGNKLEGKIFVLTGTLPSVTRPEATELITKNGGRVTSKVSNKTDYVLAGTDPGSKFEDAKKLGVEIISEEELFNMIAK